MEVREAIILAGGLGTRLQSEVANLPKCMAPINDHPFLFYLIRHLQHQGIERFIFSLGYLSTHAANYISTLLQDDAYTLVTEPYPLGTGGAVQLAMQQVQGKDVWVLNGDSICMVSLEQLLQSHIKHSATCTLALVPMHNFDRYGVVSIDNMNRITGFQEKKWQEYGLINAGIYLMEVEAFQSFAWPEKFSLENDYLQKYYASTPMYGYNENAYFLDIGIPEDYYRAQRELPLQISL
ncbi:MAG: nucleotidyltransferase family protein [Chitinophagia bacterium]|jgi:D-glycero-alpha-D-manno-heptose 1-phosphate guanylyltransferase